MDQQINVEHHAAESKEELYKAVIPQIKALISDQHDLIANLANVSAALKMTFKYYSWVGFYLMKGTNLILGPFQGKPACVIIRPGRGVCGTAVVRQQTIIVPDVTMFPGHIACDPASRSEIVVPIVKNGMVIGVLDVDSSETGSFDDIDRGHLEELVSIILNTL